MIKEVLVWIEGLVRITMVDENEEYMIDEYFDLSDAYEYDRALAMYGDREIDFMEATDDGMIRIEIL